MCGKSAIDIVQSVSKFSHLYKITLEVVKVQKDYIVLVKSLHVYIKMRCMQLFFFFFNFFCLQNVQSGSWGDM